jgi:hypothetical protein
MSSLRSGVAFAASLGFFVVQGSSARADEAFLPLEESVSIKWTYTGDSILAQLAKQRAGVRQSKGTAARLVERRIPFDRMATGASIATAV